MELFFIDVIMRRLLCGVILMLFLFPSVLGQDLAELKQTIEEDIPETLSDDLGRVPSPQSLIDSCKSVFESVKQINALPNLSDSDRYWVLRREAVALIVLAYSEPSEYYSRLAEVSDALTGQKKSPIAQETEKHVLKIGIALAVRSKPVGNVGINLQSLAERMVFYAEQYPGTEAYRLIDQFLAAVRSMDPVPRDRRLSVIAPIFQKYYISVKQKAKAESLLPDVMRSTLPGQQIMFMGVDLNGNEFDANLLNDKVILLQFWGTWCPHCKAEIPDLMSLYEKYHSAGLEIIGVNTGIQGDSEQRVKLFVEGTSFRGKKIPWLILHEGLAKRKLGMSMTEMYGIKELPVLILIGRDGAVLKLHPLPSTLDSLIAEAVSPLASVEFTEEEKKQLNEIKKKQNEELNQQIKDELSAP